MDPDKNSCEGTLFLAPAASLHPIFLPRRFLAQHPGLGMNSSAQDFLAWWRLKGHIVYSLPKLISHGPTCFLRHICLQRTVNLNSLNGGHNRYSISIYK